MDGLLKFTLPRNSKTPNTKWTAKSCHSTKHTASHAHNVGLLTGQRNDIVGVDLDTYKWGDPHAFTQAFGTDYIRTFNTLTQRTPRGGIHLIFKYEPEVRQTQSSEHEIDIRSDGGFLVGAGSVFNDKPYVICNDAPIQPMPEKNAGALYLAVRRCMVLIGLIRALRPSNTSAIMTGIPTDRMHSRYTITNAPPPYSPVMYGNFQILPNPTAEPTAARMNVQRLAQIPCIPRLSDVITIILILRRGYCPKFKRLPQAPPLCPSDSLSVILTR